MQEVVFCVQCDTPLSPKVLQSAAGWYIGRWCPNCGPYSRESGYFLSKALAEYALRGDK